MFKVIPFVRRYSRQVQDLILKIQRDEYGIPVTLDQQPDLKDINSFYRAGLGNFWVAVQDDEVIGTIGLLDIGGGLGALRKMFVASPHRGSAHGVADALLSALRHWAKEAGMSGVYLGTTDKFLAAHRFYEKNGFKEVARDDLPKSFPVMQVDSKFYHLVVRDDF